MCGVVGFVDIRLQVSADANSQEIERLTDTLVHRGPDDRGVWNDPQSGVYLGHRRLSVIDLSSAGHQPMMSASGRYVIVYNGEIYNFQELRQELIKSGDCFRGSSDTEVLLALIERYGLERALGSIKGMFAFGLWDKNDQVLHLARDRVGEKPLYFGWSGGRFIFASELKAIRGNSQWRNNISRNSLSSFLRYSYVPAPWTIFEGIFKLSAGAYLSIPLARLRAQSSIALANQSRPPQVNHYWRMPKPCRASNPHIDLDKDVIEDRLHELLRSTVSRQIISDVPVGALLSGGIDSSTIVAIMQSVASGPVKTFTIGFNEGEYNEADHAREIARRLGTDHTELFVTGKDALDVIPRLPRIYDEPFADSSQIPTILVSELARASVTVALSGDGGDELFGGYTRYFWANDVQRKLSRVPKAIRPAIGRGLRLMGAERWQRFYDLMEPFVPSQLRVKNAGSKIHTLARLVEDANEASLYLNLISHWKAPNSIVNHGVEHHTIHMDSFVPADPDDFVERMMYLDSTNYLPDDILVKVDRASMSVSLETRIPFLDHEIIEFAAQVPLRYKVQDRTGKIPLRRILGRYVPEEVFDRPKMGFGVPIDHWLRGPLRDWACDILSEVRIEREGLLNSREVTRKLTDHLSGKCDWQYPLWAVLMFESWRETYE